MPGLASGRASAALAVVATAVLAVASPPAAHAGMISIEVQPTNTLPSVPVGNLFEVIVQADINAPIIGFGFDVTFDPALASLESVAIATPFVPLVAPDGDGLAGVYFPGVSGTDVLLATARFKALKDGVANIGIGVTPGDGAEGFPEAAGVFATWTVTSAKVALGNASIPEPATALLLVVGSAVVARRRRR